MNQLTSGFEDFYNSNEKLVFTPGPTMVPPRVLRAMSKSKKSDKKNDKSRHRTMQSSGSIGRFAGYLTYKAEKLGKNVIRISERRTTKRCSYCMNKENRKLSERTISCDCGLEIDRDTSSAGTQMQRFLALLALSQKRLVVRQRLLKDIRVFREKFFSDTQPNVKRKFLPRGSWADSQRIKS